MCVFVHISVHIHAHVCQCVHVVLASPCSCECTRVTVGGVCVSLLTHVTLCLVRVAAVDHVWPMLVGPGQHAEIRQEVSTPGPQAGQHRWEERFHPFPGDGFRPRKAL